MSSPAPGAFQQIKEQTEQQVVLRLLSTLEQNPQVSQRKLASDLGIALGLMNTYLRKCMVKGWIRVSQVSAKRIGYFLTPEGFAEKSHMVKDYLFRSFSFFRDARIQCDAIFSTCQQLGFQKIALIGEGDLADIARLVASGYRILVDVVSTDADLKPYDTVIVTDVINPQGTYDAIKHKVEDHRLLTLKLLHISKVAP